MVEARELRDTLTDAVVNIAISEIPWPNGTKPLPPHLWEAARIKLQARYRRATGEPTATLYTDDRSALEAELQAAVKRAEEAEGRQRHVDDINDLVLMGLARDDAESRAATLARENDALKAERDRLDRCLALADKRADESGAIAVNNAFSAAKLASENDTLRKALERSRIYVEMIVTDQFADTGTDREDLALIDAALNPTTASKETPDAT